MGTLLHDISISIDLIFEKSPVWLLGLDKHFVQSLHVVGFNTMTEVIVHLGKLELDVSFFNQAFVTLGISKVTTGQSVRKTSDITLVSGSITFLNEQAIGLRKKKALYLTEDHCNLRKLPKTSLTFSRLMHRKHGGTTNFCAIYAFTHMENVTPMKHFKRSFMEYLDLNTPTSRSVPTKFISTEQPFPIQQNNTRIKVPLGYGQKTFGYRRVTLDELKQIYGFSEPQRRWTIARDSFPIVPPSLLHLLLRNAFTVTTKPYPDLTSFNEPVLSDQPVSTDHPSYFTTVQTPPQWTQTLHTVEGSTSSVKHDDAKTLLNMWDMRVLPLYARATSAHLESLRGFAFRCYAKRLYRNYVLYLYVRFKLDWVFYMTQRGCERYFPNNKGGVSFPFSGCSAPPNTYSFPSDYKPGVVYKSLLEDLYFGRQALHRSVGGSKPSTYFGWENGSSLLHWRWPQVDLARDGEFPYIWDLLPNSQRKVRPPKASHRPAIYEKIKKYVSRGYLEIKEEKSIKNFIDYFAAPKGESDIRLVLNGTSCGLNNSVWTSNFWLPSARTMMRHLSYEYRSVDIDIGEMFLNFPLHPSLWKYSGMDLTPFREALQKDFPEHHNLLSCPRVAAHWNKTWFGFSSSPEIAAMMYYLAEEVIRGDHRATNNPLRWDRVVLNLVGAVDYDPTMPNVYKWDGVNGRLAGDVLSYVDDLRVLGFSLEHAWLIARWFASRMQQLGIQDASRKRRVDNGPWAGGVYGTDNGRISKSVTRPKWQKGRDMIVWLVDEVLAKGNDTLCFKTLEKQRGFLCHLAMVYEVIFPYLKGFHLDLCKHYPKRNEEGWKMSDLEWIGSLESRVEEGKISRKEMENLMEVQWSEWVTNRPATVTVGVMFKRCLRALHTLFKPLEPPVVHVRSKKRRVALYGFVDASGGGYGTTVEVRGKVEYRIGTWDSGEANNSSNWREFANLVEEVERAGKKGWLDGTVVVLATDNEVVEATIHKGNSTSPLLFELVLRLKTVQLSHAFQLIVTQVAGTRMIAQGTDGVSRGSLREGVAAGQRMLDHCPWNKSALEMSPELENWVKEWISREANFLAPEQWYTLGHDIVGWTVNDGGNVVPELQASCYVWAPPPAASDACMEEIRKARMKRKESLHIVLIPKLMTPFWMRQFFRIVDVHFFVPAKVNHFFWGSNCHEALYVGIALPYLKYRPFQIRQTPKAVYMGRKLCKVFQDKVVDGGDLLRKFLQECRTFPAMRKDVVWDMLYFKSHTPFPRRLPGERVGGKRKRS